MFIVIKCKMYLQFLFLIGVIHIIIAKDLGPLTSSSQLWWGIRTPLRPRLLGSPQNVTAMVGGTASLPCSVEYLGDRSVTWMRVRDLHILTADIFTYSADDRFKILHSDNSDDWTLHIQYVTLRDEGEYECQVNSDPKISRKVYLKVNENNQLDDPGMFVESTDRRTIIQGPPDRHIQAESTLSLTCIVYHPPRDAPINLVWLKGTQILDYDSSRGGVSVKTEKLERRTISKLGVASVTSKDSGDYTCSPTNLESYTVAVHVQNGHHQAAVYQSQVNAAKRIKTSNILATFCVSVILLPYVWFSNS